MRRPRAQFVMIAVAAGALLGGCASGSGYDEATADSLQARVLAITEAVGAGDYPTADARLTELTAAADDALAQGKVSADRHDDILAAAAVVKADVDAAVTAAAQEVAAAAEKQRLADEEAARQAAEEEDDEVNENGNGGENGKGKKDD